MEQAIGYLRSFFTQATADTALKILGALVMLVTGFFVIKRLVSLLAKSLEKSKLDRGVLSFTTSLASISLKAVLVISIAVYLGVPSASFIAILSSVGLAVGLALQGSLSNFAGGLMLLMFHPFKAGDYIKAGDAEGTVMNIGVMYTTLKTFDGKKVVLPNSTLSNGVVTDFSWYDTRRMDISVSVTYDTDIPRVNALMRGIADGHPLALRDPAPDARLNEVRDGALVFTLRVWCRTPDYWTLIYDLKEQVKAALDREGIREFYPQLKLRREEAAGA